MDEEKIKEIKKKIEKKYPEFKGIEPEIKEVDVEISEDLRKKLNIGKVSHKKINTIIYRKEIDLDGEKFKKILRVKVNEEGNIIKIVQSK